MTTVYALAEKCGQSEGHGEGSISYLAVVPTSEIWIKIGPFPPLFRTRAAAEAYKAAESPQWSPWAVIELELRDE